MERIDIAVEPLGTVRPAGIAPAIPADLLAEGDVDIDRHRFLHSDAIERGLQRCLTHGIGEFHRRGVAGIARDRPGQKLRIIGPHGANVSLCAPPRLDRDQRSV